MGLFDYFKKNKTQPAEQESNNSDIMPLSDFRCYYLYGFTDEPNKTATNAAKFKELYQLVIGASGGIIISNSYHPYFIINPKGTTIWTAAYVQLAVNTNRSELFHNIKELNAIYAVDTSGIFKEMNVWPDARLTYEQNPVFGKYVPFIIPFLVSGSHHALNWDLAIKNGIKTMGHASDYVAQVTNAIRFFMPEPAFVLGFDEFDDKNPSGLIDKFINCKSMLK